MVFDRNGGILYGSEKAVVFVLDPYYPGDRRNSIYIYGNEVQSRKLGNVRMEPDRRFSILRGSFSAFYMSSPGNCRICDGFKAEGCQIPYHLHHGTDADLGCVSDFCIFAFTVDAP